MNAFRFTKTGLAFLMIFISLNFFAQKNKVKPVKENTEWFNVSDFFSLIHKDTLKNLSAMTKKYFPQTDHCIDWPRKVLCGNHTVYPPLTFMSKDMTADVCVSDQNKTEVIELSFTNRKFINDSLVLKQIKAAKFETGSYYRIEDVINAEYYRKEDNLYIETKWKDNKILLIKFK